MNALELRGVVKSYAGAPPVYALAGVDLAIGHGEMVAVVGPSGSGKSTMLNMMGTLDRPTEGSVLVDGLDTTDLDDDALTAVRGRRIGFVFQRFFLLAGVTTVDNVANGLLYTGRPLAERRAAAVRTLERVGLGHRLTHRPNELSGGETQRVAVARALVHEPAVLLADEPTGNLDSQSTAAVMGLFHELHAAGTTIVVITHDLTMAERLPRRVRVLDGRIEADSAVAG
ncbi:MAG: ABC transporter ATP-binding protein [Microthrixaceae bacterium]|nr:ABC transporter ATP-binding protein [Microthrixaceae bacterium]